MLTSFFNLVPEAILTDVERAGRRSTGRIYQLNSLENRVYEVEMEEGDPVVGKFYRPGRWSKECILEEHEFVNDLALSEVPVVEPLKLDDGTTLGTLTLNENEKIFFTVFPKVRGRSPQELDDDQLSQLGRFVARIHNVGSQKPAPHRVHLSVQTHALDPL